MRKKLLAIVVCVVFIATVPVSSDMTVGKDYDRAWVFLRGWILDPEIEGNIVHAFALRLHCTIATPWERSWGRITLSNVTFEKGTYMSSHGRVRFVLMFYFGSFDME